MTMTSSEVQCVVKPVLRGCVVEPQDSLVGLRNRREHLK